MEKLELEQKIHYGLDCQHFNVLAHSFAEYSKYQGFECSWETVPEKLCLIHSEVSEALEAHRKDDKENFAEEIADIIIRWTFKY
jgi:NTP pyrophosphatase (non-canonical NTP hydrolase)